MKEPLCPKQIMTDTFYFEHKKETVNCKLDQNLLNIPSNFNSEKDATQLLDTERSDSDTRPHKLSAASRGSRYPASAPRWGAGVFGADAHVTHLQFTAKWQFLRTFHRSLRRIFLCQNSEGEDKWGNWEQKWVFDVWPSWSCNEQWWLCCRAGAKMHLDLSCSSQLFLSAVPSSFRILNLNISIMCKTLDVGPSSLSLCYLLMTVIYFWSYWKLTLYVLLFYGMFPRIIVWQPQPIIMSCSQQHNEWLKGSSHVLMSRCVLFWGRPPWTQSDFTDDWHQRKAEGSLLRPELLLDSQITWWFLQEVRLRFMFCPIDNILQVQDWGGSLCNSFI